MQWHVRDPLVSDLLFEMPVTLSTFYADGFMMNQKGYFVMSLVYRGQLIIIFLLQLLLARGFCQVSEMWPIFFEF